MSNPFRRTPKTKILIPDAITAPDGVTYVREDKEGKKYTKVSSFISEIIAGLSGTKS